MLLRLETESAGSNKAHFRGASKRREARGKGGEHGAVAGFHLLFGSCIVSIACPTPHSSLRAPQPELASPTALPFFPPKPPARCRHVTTTYTIPPTSLPPASRLPPVTPALRSLSRPPSANTSHLRSPTPERGKQILDASFALHPHVHHASIRLILPIDL